MSTRTHILSQTGFFFKEGRTSPGCCGVLCLTAPWIQAVSWHPLVLKVPAESDHCKKNSQKILQKILKKNLPGLGRTKTEPGGGACHRKALHKAPRVVQKRSLVTNTMAKMIASAPLCRAEPQLHFSGPPGRWIRSPCGSCWRQKGWGFDEPSRMKCVAHKRKPQIKPGCQNSQSNVFRFLRVEPPNFDIKIPTRWNSVCFARVWSSLAWGGGGSSSQHPFLFSDTPWGF